MSLRRSSKRRSSRSSAREKHAASSVKRGPTVGSEPLIVGVTGNVLALSMLRHLDIMWKNTELAGRAASLAPTTVLIDKPDTLWIGYAGTLGRLDLASGATKYKASIKGMGGRELSIAVAEKQYVFVGVHGHIIALKREDGVELWRYHLPKGSGSVALVAHHDGLIYAGSNCNISALDPVNFKELWNVTTPHSGPVTIGFTRDTSTSATGNPGSYWLFRVVGDDGPDYVNDGTSIESDLIFLGGGGYLSTLASAGSKKIMSEMNLKGTGYNAVSQVLRKGTLFVGTNKSIAAINPSDGKVLWINDTAPGARAVAMVYASNVDYAHVMQGVMVKKGSGRVTNTWVKKHFFLTHLSLLYYNELTDRMPTRMMSLHNATLVDGVPDSALNSVVKGSSVVKRERPNSFTVIDNTKTVPEFYLDVETEDLRQKWVESIAGVHQTLDSGRPEPWAAPAVKDRKAELELIKVGVVPPHTDVLFVGTSDRVLALEPKSGVTIWQRALDANGFVDSGFIVSLVYQDKLLWAGGPEGKVYGMDPRTGRVLIVNTLDGFGAGHATIQTASRPIDTMAQPVSAFSDA